MLLPQCCLHGILLKISASVWVNGHVRLRIKSASNQQEGHHLLYIYRKTCWTTACLERPIKATKFVFLTNIPPMEDCFETATSGHHIIGLTTSLGDRFWCEIVSNNQQNRRHLAAVLSKILSIRQIKTSNCLWTIEMHTGWTIIPYFWSCGYYHWDPCLQWIQTDLINRRMLI